jgi:hypothetical protein
MDDIVTQGGTEVMQDRHDSMPNKEALPLVLALARLVSPAKRSCFYVYGRGIDTYSVTIERD